MADPNNPTLVNAFQKWPYLLNAFQDHEGNRWTKKQIESCLEWAIGEDWKDLRFDLLPSRLMLRLNLIVVMEEDPLTTFRRIADKWWTTMWVLQTSQPSN